MEMPSKNNYDFANEEWMANKLCFNSLTEICPGAELLPALPNVIEDPNISPLSRLIEP